MNERQRRFCEEYAKNPNAAEAARAAGYSERTARAQGQRMLTNVDIQKYIAELQAALTSERIADVREVKERLTAVMRDENERTNNRIRAGEALLKSAGATLPPAVKRGEAREPGEDEPPTGIYDRDTEIVLPWSGEHSINGILKNDGSIIHLIPGSMAADSGPCITFVLTEDQAGALLDPALWRNQEETDT